MKLLHVSPSYMPATKYGGPLVSVHTLNRYLIADGHQVDVITSTAGIPPTHPARKDKAWKLDGVSIRYFDFWGYEHFNFNPEIYFHLKKIVHQYDMVHITAFWNFPVLAAAAACMLRGVPYVVSPRGTLYPETIAMGSAWLKRLYLKTIGKYILRSAAAIHVTSDDEANGFLKIFPHPKAIRIVPNGIDMSQWYAIPEVSFRQTYANQLEGNDYLLFLGRIHYKKGLDLLWKAAPAFFHAYPEARWVIAGPESDTFGETLRTEAVREGFAHKIIWTGPLQQPLLKAAYAEARWNILPSYSENFAMTVLESLISGCPVLLSRKVALAAEVMRYGAGWTFDPTPEAVSQCLLEWWPKTDMRAAMAESGHELVAHHFEAGLTTRLMEQLYADLICLK